MYKVRSVVFIALLLAFSAGHVRAQNTAPVTVLPMDSIDELEVHTAKLDAVEVVNTKPEVTTYRGRRAIRLVNIAGHQASGAPSDGETIAILKGSDFKNGTVEAEVIGVPRPGAQPAVRGFVGIAFRVAPNGSKYECFSIRQTNGRADDQLRRNHTTQYSSYPEFRWSRLRKENPGVYESYADVEENTWTKIKITVSGNKAQLYVNGADQPCLIVNDLKLGETQGQVALWAGTDTEGYFSNLIVK